MKMYANLHLHTTHSDGKYSPDEIVKIAKKEGYKALAISDHDVASGYKEFEEACKREGLECIFAVEFSVQKPLSCHMVAFDFDPEYPPMKEYLRLMGIRQTDNTKCCFDEAVALGNIKGITWDEVIEYNKGIGWLCNEHVFNAMMAKGLIKEEEYRQWFDLNFRVQRGKYPPKCQFMELGEIVDMVKAAGGFVVLAHPHNMLHRIDEYISYGIEGIEVWHPDLTEEEKKEAYRIALEKDLYISGGSDHSGLCGGLYDTFDNEKELKESIYYIEPISVGTTEKYFRELKTRKKNR